MGSAKLDILSRIVPLMAQAYKAGVSGKDLPEEIVKQTLNSCYFAIK